MNEKIQHIIQEIRTKKDALKESLSKQTTKANQLEQEVEQLKSELLSKDNQLLFLEEEQTKLQDEKSKLENDKVELKSLLEETKVQVVNTASSENKVDHGQIDELVREIEYCIGQLKNNA